MGLSFLFQISIFSLAVNEFNAGHEGPFLRYWDFLVSVATASTAHVQPLNDHPSKLLNFSALTGTGVAIAIN